MKRGTAVTNLVLLLLHLSGVSAQAQSSVETLLEGGLQVRQRPGSEEALREYFKEIEDQDTIYAVIFSPSNCPRCEAMLTPLYESVKTQRPNNVMTLIAAYPDSVAAVDYCNRHRFLNDTLIVDRKEGWKDFLSFSFGTLHIPYLLKVVPSKGELVVGTQTYSNSDEFVNDFCSWTKPMEKHEYLNSVEQTGVFLPSEVYMRATDTLVVRLPEGKTLSSTEYNVEFEKDRLLFNDRLGECVVSFKESDSSPKRLDYNGVIRPSLNLAKTFVEVDDTVFNWFYNSGGVKFIPLTPIIFNDTTVAISYSLPHIWMEDEESVGYMNKKCVYVFNPFSKESGRIVPLDDDGSGDFFYAHFNLYRWGQDYAIGCHRITWPSSVEREDYEGIPELDPFNAAFYQEPQPTIALFDSSTGQLEKRVMQLPKLAEETLTGCALIEPFVATYGSEVVYSDGVTGRIQIINLTDSSLVKSLEIFSIPETVLPAPDSSKFYSEECLAAYRPIFNRQIIDIKATDDFIYCLVEYADIDHPTRHSVFKIDRSCDCVEEQSFPPMKGDYGYYGLRRLADGGVAPFNLEKDGENWHVNIFEFNHDNLR